MRYPLGHTPGEILHTIESETNVFDTHRDAAQLLASVGCCSKEGDTLSGQIALQAADLGKMYEHDDESVLLVLMNRLVSFGCILFHFRSTVLKIVLLTQI